MDGSRFDDLLRSAAASRRGTLKVAIGVAVAALSSSFSGNALASKDPFQRVGKKCEGDADCGPYAVCHFPDPDATCLKRNGKPGKCPATCQATHCVINGVPYVPPFTNPDNPCQACLSPGTVTWSTLADGAACAPGPTDDPCRTSFAGTCNAGVCEPVAANEGGTCGDDLSPCTAQTCQAGMCTPTVKADGADCDNGTNEPCVNRFGLCQAGTCVGNEEPDGSSCGFARECCHGVCCQTNAVCNALGQCASDDGGGGCQGDACTGICIINGVTYNFGDRNPTNPCEWCTETSETPTRSWHPVPSGLLACGEPPVIRDCCNGVCCLPGECCGGIDGLICTTIGCGS